MLDRGQGGAVLVAKVKAPRIVVDTREQLPYKFGKLESVRKKLDAGDYSLEGLESQVAVERKSKPDAYGCVGKGRDRFERHLEKLAQLDCAAIVIEDSLEDFWAPPPHTLLSGSQAVGSYTAWGVKYGLQIQYAGNRNHAKDWVVRFLLAYYRYFVEEAP